MMRTVAPSAAVADAPCGRGWRWVAYTWAAVIALAVGYFVARIPVQVTDCLANLIQVQDATWLRTLTAGVGAGYMRPLLWVQIKGMFELANGEYTALFRGIHVMQVLGCGLLFIGALRVRDAAGALAAPFGLAMLLGNHTSYGTLHEAFPINSFLSIVLACLAALNLSFGPPARWRDAVAVLLFLVMVLTVESGILVWWCLVVAAAVGARGVSRKALVLSTVCVAVYLFARFAFLQVGTPGLMERSSGFGLRMLEPQELQARFGAAPWLFYGYNVASQVLTVLFGEPTGGIWIATRDWQAGVLTPAKIIRVVTSSGATLLILGYVAARFGRWRRRLIEDDDRVVLVFLAVLGANAVLSFPYTKDVIVSPAGALHALAAAIALAALLRGLAAARICTAVPASIFIAVLTTGATIRLAGMCYMLREVSFVTRNEWTEVEAWAERNRIDLRRADRAALVSKLRNEAMRRRVPPPAFADPDWSEYVY